MEWVLLNFAFIPFFIEVNVIINIFMIFYICFFGLTAKVDVKQER